MRDAVTAASFASPPDLIITVGNLGREIREDNESYGYQFVAHKHLVSIHSGYLKSLIQNESRDSGMTVMNISLPNISSDSFGPLLSFMYTGYLELTNENIYSVLLATHLLHMPRALDICHAYLFQNQTKLQPRLESSIPFPTHSSYNIVKPIPSRKVQNFSHSIWSPVNIPPLMIQTRPDGPFQCVSPNEKPEPISSDASKNGESNSPLAIPSTSKVDESFTTDRLSPSFSDSSFTSDDRTVHVIKSPPRNANKKKDNHVKNNRKVNNENLKVEYDVACCDGPIRFHRVINESYGMSLDEIIDETSGKQKEDDEVTVSDKEYLENYPNTQSLKLKSSKNFSRYMHQQMLNSNLFKKPKTTKGVIQMRKVIEKEITPTNEVVTDEKIEDEKDDQNSERSYTCLHCKHTFKSQYCYRKHTKRHINSVEENGGTSKNCVILRQVVSNPQPVDDKKDGVSVRREVRLLDMNVQYYPCKTCGSKFPSYYFVHKHRKLCHSNEENFNENDHQQLDHSDSSSSDHTLNQGPSK